MLELSYQDETRELKSAIPSMTTYLNTIQQWLKHF